MWLETVAGQRFTQVTLPKLTDAMEEMNRNLERSNKNNENQIEDVVTEIKHVRNVLEDLIRISTPRYEYKTLFIYQNAIEQDTAFIQCIENGYRVCSINRVDSETTVVLEKAIV